MVRTATCPLCEASCGILVDTDGERIRSIRGDEDDPFSRGYICPKAAALADLHDDPDRLRAPLIRDGSSWREVVLGGGAGSGGRRPRPRAQAARARRGRDVLRQSGRAQPRSDDARAAVRARASDQERLFGELGRSAAADARGAPHVRTSRAHSGARSRAHRLLPHLRRQPGRVERQPHDRAGHEAAVCAPSAIAAGASSSSIRGAPRRRRSPTSTSPSGPAPTPCCSRRCCTWCSRRDGRAWGASTAG